MRETSTAISNLTELDLSERDIALLRAVITHSRQVDIANELGYSDRHTRRLLNELVERLQVPTTHAAVADAVAADLIRPVDTSDDGMNLWL